MHVRRNLHAALLAKRRPGRRPALLAALSLPVSVLVAVSVHSTPVAADTDPPAPLPATVSADALPTVQIDGVVWAQVTVGNTVYATGSFTKARPAGTSPGDSAEVTRSNLLAYDITTGNLVASFNHTLNAQGLAITASPDGSTVYVGGDFSIVDGVTRQHIAAFSTATGALITTFRPNVASQVRAIAATNSTVYVGGNFVTAGGVDRTRLAAFQAGSGALLSWAPTADDNLVNALLISPDGTTIVVGGKFSRLNGLNRGGIGAVDAATGASAPWNSAFPIRDTGDNSGFTSLATDGTNVYGSGYNFHGNGGSGNFEGRFGSDFAGNVLWLDTCHGDSYGVFVQQQVLYSVHHAHDCSDNGAFDDTNPRTYHRASAETLTPSGKPLLANTNSGYANFAGQPGNTLLHWWPNLSAGTYTGQVQAAWSVTGNDRYISLGGEFPKINGSNQQGLVRFAVRSVAPNKSAPAYVAAMTPSVVSLSAGTARVRWRTTWDMDDNTLQYRVYRDGGSTPVFTTSASSTFWQLPYLGFVDSGLAPGSTHTYRVSVFDPSNNRINGALSAPVTISSTPVTQSTYAGGVLADGATDFWPLSEDATTATGYDYGPAYDDLTLGTNVTRGVDGPVLDDPSTATAFGGTSAGTSAASTLQYGPDTFSVEAWLKTSSTTGGKVVGFGDTAGAASTNNDRQIYLDNAGHVLFGVDNGAKKTIASSGTFNDNTWHHVVATLSPAGGMTLYVDGARVARDQSVTTAAHYQGYWRVGGDTTSGWPSAPTSPYFKGSVADVAIYPSALGIAGVQQHYRNSGRSISVPPAPTDAYGQAVTADVPDLYWRLDETGGTTAADSSVNAANGVFTTSGVTRGVTPAFASSTRAAALNGTSGALASVTTFPTPVSYSTELWFKTTTRTGGRLIGFSSAQTGTSTSFDRQVVMTTAGRLTFGANNSAANTLTSASAYNDGIWHQVVATQGPAGMTLYVDGLPVASNSYPSALKYTGYWRVGSDRTASGGANNWFAGSVDEVAVYPSTLASDRVLAHYNASGATGVNQPPTASVTAPSCTYLTCTFDASSSSDPDGTIASTAWDFGDGTTGTGATTSHAYAAAGTYTATVTVTDDSGATASATVSVTVVAAPVATFTVSCAAHTCSFDASSSTPGTGAITGYAWDFGDGATDTGAAPTHEYATAGPRTVTLTVTDSAGGTATSTRTVTPQDNHVPTAAFSVSCLLLVCTFDASSSLDDDGTITDYSWQFGDGATAAGAATLHLYPNLGTYSATLTVTDNLGATSSTTKTFVAGNAAPSASFTATCTDLSCALDASASGDTDGSIASYAWDFGDGTTGTGVAPTHPYAAAGSYTVTLTVTDDQGATATTSRSVTATTPPLPTPFAGDAFNRTTTSGFGTADTGGAWTTTGTTSVTPGTGRFTLAAGGTGTANLAGVSQNDADITTAITLNKAPTGGGVYFYVVGRRPGTNKEYRARVRLLASGAVGISFTKLDNSSTETTVKSETVVPGLTYTAGATLRLRVQVTGTSPTTLRARAWLDGTSEPTTWTTATDSAASLQTTGAVGLRAYASGSITNAPVVVGVTGLTARRTSTAPPPANTPPAAAFTPTCTNLSCAFDATASGDTDGSIASYAWDFGDGTTGTGVAPTHPYTAAGSYTVTLTVTDDRGATASTTRTVSVTAAPPASAPFANDAFNRTTTTGFGTADTGGAWTTTGTTSVSPGAAKFTLNAGGSGNAYLSSVSQNDADITAAISVNKAPTGSGTYFYVIGRRPGTNKEYRAQIRLLASGAVGISFTKLDNSSTETTVKSETVVPGLTYTVGATLRLRVQVTGTSPTTLRARAWLNGTTEPTTWTSSTTDSAASLQTTGAIGLRAYLSGSTTNAPVTVSIATLTAKPTA